MGAALREKRREVGPFAVAGRACACDARELLRRGHTRKDISKPAPLPNRPARAPPPAQARALRNLRTMNDSTLRTVFRAFDIDNSGGIDLVELQSAIAVIGVPITRPRVAAMFREADTDNSGQIDCESCALRCPQAICTSHLIL